MIGLLCQRAVQRDNVGRAEQFVQGDVRNGHVNGRVNGHVIGRILVIRQDAHSESAADIHENPPDASGSDDADCFAVQIKARHVVQAEIEVSRSDIRLVDAPD